MQRKQNPHTYQGLAPHLTDTVCGGSRNGGLKELCLKNEPSACGCRLGDTEGHFEGIFLLKGKPQRGPADHSGIPIVAHNTSSGPVPSGFGCDDGGDNLTGRCQSKADAKASGGGVEVFHQLSSQLEGVVHQPTRGHLGHVPLFCGCLDIKNIGAQASRENLSSHRTGLATGAGTGAKPTARIVAVAIKVGKIERIIGEQFHTTGRNTSFRAGSAIRHQWGCFRKAGKACHRRTFPSSGMNQERETVVINREGGPFSHIVNRGPIDLYAIASRQLPQYGDWRRPRSTGEGSCCLPFYPILTLWQVEVWRFGLGMRYDLCVYV